MAIRYNVDSIQLFRGVLFAEGWCWSGDGGTQLEILIDDEPIPASIERFDRPDVSNALGRPAALSGFRVRAFITGPFDGEALSFRIRAPDDVLEVSQPQKQCLDLAYKGYLELTDRFFGDIYSAGSDVTVLEIGARARSGHVRKSLFGDVKYIGFDIAAGENVDIVGDAHSLSRHFDSDSIDFCYSVSVFEHLMWPWVVAIELGKVMKIGGRALMQSHFAWPKHEAPWDFFRFSDSGWRALFCNATGFRVLQTDESHAADIVARPFSGGPVHAFEGQPAFLASTVLVEKVCAPRVSWNAEPPLAEFGAYPG